MLYVCVSIASETTIGGQALICLIYHSMRSMENGMGLVAFCVRNAG